MKFKDLKSKTEKDLKKLLLDTQNHLRDLRFKGANDQVKNVRELRTTKRTIQRINFLLDQKNKEANQALKVTKE